MTGVTLNKSSLALEVGNTETLTATVAPANATNKTVIWTSNSSVAPVSGGTVTGLAAGSATITATTQDGSRTAACSVTVTTATDPDNIAIPSTPIVRGPNGVVGIDEGTNYHLYKITATSAGAGDWETPILPSGSISTITKTPGTEAKVGEWQYTPRLLEKSGTETITFRSKATSQGPPSEDAYFMMVVKENHGPVMPARLKEDKIYVSRNVPAYIAFLQFKDEDGDAIDWQNPTDTFIDNGGRVTIQADGLMVFNASNVSKDGQYTAVISYEERDPRTQAMVGRPIANNVYTINVVVGDKSSGRDPNMGPG